MADETKSNEAAARFPNEVNRFFSNYCAKCHGPDESEGDLVLDTFSQDLVNGPHAEDWHEVLDALNKGEMPPEDEEQPSKAERDEVTEFLTGAFKQAAETRRSTGGKVVLRRLTNYEYNNTLNDLLALNEDWSKDFPPDSFSNDGFKNNGYYMGISAMQIESYIEAAKRALDEAIVVGDRPELKTGDKKTDRYFTGPHGKTMDVYHKSRHYPRYEGMIAWRDFPRRGPVLVEATISDVDDPDSLIGQIKLSVGKRIRNKGPIVYGFKDTELEPEVSVRGDLVHVRYIIPKIEAYPLPEPYGTGDPGNHELFWELVLNITHEGSPKNSKVQNMTAAGPYYETWLPKSHQQVFIPSDNADNEDAYAREILDSFTTRAWRRDVSSDEVDTLHQAYLEHRKEATFVDSIKNTLVRVLIAPDFLYLVEDQNPDGQREPLNDYELANRMSYFLWSSMPDEGLMRLADEDKLASPQTIRAQVQRMLQDERSDRFVEHFTSQWLGLYKMNSIAVSPEVYPRFDERLKVDMKGQTEHFFAYVLRENLSALNFIDSDFTFLNVRLSRHFADNNKFVFGGSSKFNKVQLPEDSERGGLLSHASIHLANSDGEDSHPIARGVWLVDRILGNPSPSPPADIEFDDDIQGFEQMTLKQQLEVHLQKESCARCHVKFDPYGVAFEEFDVVGAFRNKIRKVDEEERAKQIEAVTIKPDPEIAFKKMDRDNGGYVTQEEWDAYIDASYPDEPKGQREGRKRHYKKVAAILNDREQSTHPQNTIALIEYVRHVEQKEQRAIEQINNNPPFRYIEVDASVELPDGTKVQGLSGLKAYLLKQKKDEFAENIVRRLLTYTLGRTLEFSDQPTIDGLTERFAQNDYKLGSLVEDIVLSDVFQTK